MWQLISAIVVLVAPVLIIVYDMIAYKQGGSDATISAAVSWFASKFPELPAIAAAFFVWLWLHLFMQPVLEGINRRHPPVEPPAIKNGKNGTFKGE